MNVEGAQDGGPAASTEALPDAGVASRDAAPAPAPRRAAEEEAPGVRDSSDPMRTPAPPRRSGYVKPLDAVPRPKP